MIIKTHAAAIGVFVTVGIVLFGAVLFLIGNQHQAFRRHVDFYTTFINVDGIAKGSKVKVHGMDAGTVEKIDIPSNPAEPFRLELHVDEQLHGLIREDSIVTIGTEGIVGDKFLLVEDGTANSAVAANGSTLRSKEPFEMSKLLEQAQGIMLNANSTMNDVRTHLDLALDSATSTIHNADGLVGDIRHGKGTAGMLLEDKATAADVRDTIKNAESTSGRMDQSVAKVDGILSEVQHRELVGKMDQTLVNTRSTTRQLNEMTGQVKTTLDQAFAEDQYGQVAGQNLRQSLSNINVATGNLADDTEALKHQFLLKGFFKHRGYYNLNDIPVNEYRQNQVFNGIGSRYWIEANDLFETDGAGNEVLSDQGRLRIDAAVSQMKEMYGAPIVVEGYSKGDPAAQQLFDSRRRAITVRSYLELHYRVPPKNIGIVGLKDSPPINSQKNTWDGVCLVVFENRQK